MKKLLLSIAVIISICTTAFAWDQIPPQSVQLCQSHAPWGFPQTSKTGIAICRHAYATLNDPVAKIAIWTAYTLTPVNALGCIPRSNAFAPDASIVKGHRAELTDYAKSGYDMGHIAPAGDMSFDQQAEAESFLLTNMTPQWPSINRGGWKLLETSVRGWAYQLNDTFTIYAGPIYSIGDKTIGPDNVVVPHGYFKIVINDNTKEVAGWIFPNHGDVGNDLRPLRATIAAIGQQTSIQFAIPTGARELPVGKEWAIDFGKLTASKKAKCGSTAED